VLAAENATVAQLSSALAAKSITSRELTAAFLERIAALDQRFGAVRCIAPDALDQADRSDRVRRESGPRSPLEGLAVLVKDNIEVAGLPTTGGTLALEASYPAADAPIVARLREGGAVVLGKTNLTELANFMSAPMPSGYSSLGGQVLNPYDATLTPSGSSSGSAAAVALGLCVVAVGTETDGSITSPAEAQSLVGLKPTLGLVSRTGVLPIASSQDTPGPLARTVADAAALLQMLAGPDARDPATARAHLDEVLLGEGSLRGVRLGVVVEEAEQPSCHAEALAALQAGGAQLVEVRLPALDHVAELAVLTYEFARDLDRYLAALPAAAPIRSLAALRAWNLEHSQAALKYGQSHLDDAAALDLEAARPAYEQARAGDHARATQVLDRALDGGLDALVLPGANGASLAARAGWPSIVLPVGYAPRGRRPVGLMLVSRPWTDARLLRLAYGLERQLPARRPPWEVNPAAFRDLRAPHQPGVGSSSPDRAMTRPS